MSEDWISAREARELVSPGCTFVGQTTDAIRRHAAAGLIRAKALVFVSTRAGQKSEARNHPIPNDFWGEAPEKQDWGHGYFSVRRRSQGWEVYIEALGVTFERRGVAAMMSASGAESHSRQRVSGVHATPAPAKKNPGGRPSYDWEAVMIEMARQLYVGDLQPKTQADIEKAIATYIPDKDSKSESTIREHARRLWQAIQSEDSK